MVFTVALGEDGCLWSCRGSSTTLVAIFGINVGNDITYLPTSVTKNDMHCALASLAAAREAAVDPDRPVCAITLLELLCEWLLLLLQCCSVSVRPYN